MAEVAASTHVRQLRKSMPARDRFFLASGPFLGLSLVGLSVLGNSGPGFFLLSLAAACLLTVVAPLVQVALRGIPRIRERPGLRAAIALVSACLLITLIGTAEVFNQW